MKINKLLLATTALLGVAGPAAVAHARQFSKEAYGIGITQTAAALDGSATTVTVTSGATVSSTAVNVAGVNRLVAFRCDQATDLAIVDGTGKAGPIVLTAATGYSLGAGEERTLTVPDGATVAFIAEGTTASCKMQPLKH